MVNFLRKNLFVASKSCMAKTFFTKSIPSATFAMNAPFMSELMKSTCFPSWPHVAEYRKTRRVRDGEVAFIR